VSAESGHRRLPPVVGRSMASSPSAALHHLDVTGGLELVLFNWAGLCFALQASQVRALRSAVDPTQPSIGALLGLDGARSDQAEGHGPTPTSVNGRASVMPASAARPTERLLEVSATGRCSPQHRACFRVQEPVQTRFFAASALRPLPPLLAACLQGGAVRAIARELVPGQSAGAVRLIPILDVRGLPSLE